MDVSVHQKDKDFEKALLGLKNHETDAKASFQRALGKVSDAKMVLTTLKHYNQVGSVLHTLADVGDVITIRMIMKALDGEDIYSLISLPDSGGRTALHWAAITKNVECFLYMLSPLERENTKVVLQQKDAGGNTVVHYAVRNDLREVVHIVFHKLLRTEVNQLFTIRNREGKTPLDFAREFNWNILAEFESDENMDGEDDISGKYIYIVSAETV